MLSKYYARYARFYEQPKFANIHETSYDESLIKNNKSGWIIVDEVRYWSYRKKLSQKNFYLDETKIEEANEFHVVPHSHFSMLWSSDVAEKIKSFLSQ